MTANAENTGVSVQETAAISENKAPEAEVVANQMKDYYLSETEPQGDTFYAFDVSAMQLPETDEEGNGRLLEVPLYRQSHNFTCGVACVASVLRYAGYDFDTREDRLLWELAATPENGTNYLKIAEYLDAVRMDGFPDTPVFATEIMCTDYASDEHDPALSDHLPLQFRAALDDDTPVICVIQAWGRMAAITRRELKTTGTMWCWLDTRRIRRVIRISISSWTHRLPAVTRISRRRNSSCVGTTIWRENRRALPLHSRI